MESLHYLLMKSHAMLSRSILSQANKIGLTSGQPKILDFLLKSEEADQKTIASYCEIEPATVGSILMRMEENGLVLRRQKEGNRRSLYVSLTEEGKQSAEKLMDIFNEAENMAVSNMTDEEIKVLKETLCKLCDTIKINNESKKV